MLGVSGTALAPRAATTGRTGRVRAADARRDLGGSVELHTGFLRFVRPHDAAVLLDLKDVVVDEAYSPSWATLTNLGLSPRLIL